MKVVICLVLSTYLLVCVIRNRKTHSFCRVLGKIRLKKRVPDKTLKAGERGARKLFQQKGEEM